MPQDQRSMTDRLVILGAKGGPAIRKGGPNPTASLLIMDGRPHVIDCGLGVTRGLVEAGVPLKALETIWITHLHSDHVLELGPLLHTAWTAGLATPVTVHGPPGTRAVWDHFRASLGYDIALRIEDEGRPDLAALVSVEEYGEGRVAEGVHALRVHHPPVTDCFALRFEHDGWRVTFSSDTAHFPPLAEFAKGSDILVHEAMLMEGVDRLVARVGNGARLREHLVASHSTAAEAGRIAAEAGARHLVLHHLIPADDPEVGPADWERAVRETWDGPLTIARDGTELLREEVPA